MKKITARSVEIGEYKAWLFETKPPRLESIFSFHNDHFSQKLTFNMMNITHKYGISCAAPVFGNEKHPEQVIFCIGIELPSTRSLRKYSMKMESCLNEISQFNDELSSQLDFSVLDLSMFGGIDFTAFDPLMLATIRDQHYNGSWEEFHTDLMKDDRQDDADLIVRCKTFEDKNFKDIALVANQLDQTISMVEEALVKGEQ